MMKKRFITVNNHLNADNACVYDFLMSVDMSHVLANFAAVYVLTFTMHRPKAAFTPTKVLVMERSSSRRRLHMW